MSLIGPEGRKQLKLAARFASAGFELAMSILIGYFAGRWMDQALYTGSVLQYLGLLIGIAAGFRSLYLLAKTAQANSEDRPQDRDDKNNPNTPR